MTKFKKLFINHLDISCEGINMECTVKAVILAVFYISLYKYIKLIGQLVIKVGTFLHGPILQEVGAI